MNLKKFVETNGEGLRQIIKVRHEELGQRISGSEPRSEEWTRLVRYNNCVHVLETEIRHVGENDKVYITEDLDAYKENVRLFESKELLNMYYVKIALTEKEVRAFIVYLAKY